MMHSKITVLTPRNQAETCIKTQRMALVGLTKIKDIVEEKIVSHDKFYWIVSIKGIDEHNNMVKKAAKGEVMIKKFYSTLFKLIHRANQLATKFKKGREWIKRWIIKMVSKQYPGQDDATQFKEYLNSLDDEGMTGLIEITDKEYMQGFLSQPELITVELLTDYDTNKILED